VSISTRAGGVFDAVATSDTCDYNGELQIIAESGGTRIAGRSAYCHGRLRFVVPASDVRLTILGYKSTTWDLIYREPR
jgi:hypothetical protein